MTDKYKLPEIEIIAKDLSRTLIDHSIRPAMQPELIKSAIGQSLAQNTPLRVRMVLCPNWQVTPRGRSIGEIPVSITPERKLEYPNPSMKIIGLLTEEVPEVINKLNRNGVRVELLIILADILSSGWVHDAKDAKEKLAQNQQAIKLLLGSSEKGREVFNDKEKANLKIQSQLQLATNTEGYEQNLNRKQMEAMQMGTPMFEWYMKVVKQMQDMGEYEDQRTNVAGMRKIWERALFLAGIYATDGEVFRKDFETARFGPDLNHAYMGLGSVATPHGDIIAQGWNLKIPIGVITPFNNAMEHSWSEPRKPSLVF